MQVTHKKQVIKKKQTATKLNWSQMTLDRYAHDPDYAHFGFPRPRYIGRNPVWIEAEIDEWLESLPRESA